MVGGKNKKTDVGGYEAKKMGTVGGNVAGVLVGVGLMFVGSVFVMTGFTGDKPIVALIFGGVCVLAGISLIVGQIINQFRKKTE
jgi:hypothetical protein